MLKGLKYPVLPPMAPRLTDFAIMAWLFAITGLQRCSNLPPPYLFLIRSTQGFQDESASIGLQALTAHIAPAAACC